MNPLFEWSGKGPSLVVMAICLLVLSAVASMLVFKKMIAAFGGFVLFATACVLVLMFISNKIYGSYIRISEGEIAGYMPFEKFEIRSGEIESIERSVFPKTGAQALHVFKKGEKRGVRIPFVTDERQSEYFEAIKIFCSRNGILLKW